MLFILALCTLKGITKTGSYSFILVSEVQFLHEQFSVPRFLPRNVLAPVCHVISFTATADFKSISVIFAIRYCHGRVPLCSSILFTSDIIWLFTLALGCGYQYG